VAIPLIPLVGTSLFIEVWPPVDALICFYSDGFPYLMAWHYVQKHRPFLINSLDRQQLLWDRTAVYEILKKIKVPVAKHYFILRDKNYLDAIEEKGNGKVIPPPPCYSLFI
jgi:glutathione synthase/RimK-type ligase-like ATP-grasp enzyme